MEQCKHDELKDLAWSYAAIIGVIEPLDVDMTDKDFEAARKRWGT
jgi:hypothetical protein